MKIINAIMAAMILTISGSATASKPPVYKITVLEKTSSGAFVKTQEFVSQKENIIRPGVFWGCLTFFRSGGTTIELKCVSYISPTLRVGTAVDCPMVSKDTIGNLSVIYDDGDDYEVASIRIECLRGPSLP